MCVGMFMCRRHTYSSAQNTHKFIASANVGLMLHGVSLFLPGRKFCCKCKEPLSFSKGLEGGGR